MESETAANETRRAERVPRVPTMPGWLADLSGPRAGVSEKDAVERIDPGIESDATPDADTHDFWGDISEQDYAYLTAPRNPRTPCLFCGGRAVHSQLCIEQQRSWIVMPRGKYKDEAVSKVPREYLRWFIATVDGIPPEVQSEIERVMTEPE